MFYFILSCSINDLHTVTNIRLGLPLYSGMKKCVYVGSSVTVSDIAKVSTIIVQCVTSKMVSTVIVRESTVWNNDKYFLCFGYY